MFFIANDVDDSKKAATLLSCIGPKTYQLLRSLTAPSLPSSKTYEELKVTLNTHLSPQPLEIVERFRFHKRQQRDGESIQAFVVEIKRLSEHCRFGQTLDQALRDRLVCGLTDASIQQKLMQEVDLTFQKAYDKAIALEMATRDATELHSSASNNHGTIHAMAQAQSHRKHPTSNPNHSQQQHFPHCASCGKSNHKRENCFFKNAECKACHKTGHILNLYVDLDLKQIMLLIRNSSVVKYTKSTAMTTNAIAKPLIFSQYIALQTTKSGSTPTLTMSKLKWS